MPTIDGLVSGLDTTALIDSLITLQAGPQSLLKNKQSTASSLVTALQSLNTKVASLAEHAAKASKAQSWNAVTASASGSGVTAAAKEGAQAGTLTLRVGAVAASQSSLLTLPAAADYGTATPTFTITRNGETTSVTAQSTSVADVVEAFNSSGSGVRATAIKVPELDGDGNPTGGTTYRVQLTGTDTGAANAFTVTRSATDGTAPVALEQIRAAADASVTLFAGTSAQQTLTSASNTFEGLMSGIDVTVSAVTAADAPDVTLTVASDKTALRALASGLVSNLGAILGDITSRTASTTSTASDGGSVVKGGLFSGDSTIRFLQQNLLAQASAPVNGVSPSDVGIVIGKDGTFSFDQEKFDAALAADPSRVQSIVSTVAERLAGTAKSASDSSTGSLTLSIQSQQALVKDLGERITDWDDRLAMRRTSLERVYAALETSMANLQSQSSYLTSQINALTSSKSS
ncbi:MAG: flagellar filament capping protein FliD [Cellulomonas sp.]|uniref:flagellar filament capping protein FliD n=1 Tax=unclassified Cellulomonas TaxID=2620175 RepID=UPI0006528034|nr:MULTISPECIES: flagellar filament capping protein FliD [unclassified Cellulomonas]KMM46907.1 acyl-CoA desaturase [Cellulomonas sp. A375-1]MCR6649597.1 flagellar filament capping protein FliD [Cellulomonas sp.]MCR6705568.1 flagellar filament capping protein FliD [Cellulomonas sp.]